MAELIIFEVAHQQMGVLAQNVLEIIQAVAVTSLGDCQPPFVGVLNYRGTICPVARLNPNSQPDILEHMILVRKGNLELICLVVDRVLNFTATDQIVTLTEVNEAGFQNLKLTRELARVGNDLIPLFNLETLLIQVEQLHQASTELTIITN